MPYATRADIEAIYTADFVARLVDRDGDGGDEADVAEALAAASSEVDSHVGQRYAVPLPVVPAFVRRIAVDIAVYVLAHSAARLTEEIAERYKSATRHLERIADGRASLAEAEAANRPPADPDTGSCSVQFDGDGRRFTRDTMTGL